MVILDNIRHNIGSYHFSKYFLNIYVHNMETRLYNKVVKSDIKCKFKLVILVVIATGGPRIAVLSQDELKLLPGSFHMKGYQIFYIYQAIAFPSGISSATSASWDNSRGSSIVCIHTTHTYYTHLTITVVDWLEHRFS